MNGDISGVRPGAASGAVDATLKRKRADGITSDEDMLDFIAEYGGLCITRSCAQVSDTLPVPRASSDCNICFLSDVVVRYQQLDMMQEDSF